MTTFTIAYDHVREIAGAVVPFIGKGQNVPILELIEFRAVDEGTVVVSATDRYRIAVLSVPLVGVAEPESIIRVPGILLTNLVKTLPHRGIGTISLTRDENTVTVTDNVSGSSLKFEEDPGMGDLPFRKLVAGILEDAIMAQEAAEAARRSETETLNHPLNVPFGVNPNYLADLKKAGQALKSGSDWSDVTVTIHSSTASNKPRLCTIGERFLAIYMPVRVDEGEVADRLAKWEDRGFRL